MLPRIEDQHPPLGDAVSCQGHQPYFYLGRQSRRFSDIKSQLYGCRYLIDILPSRARGPHEIDLEFALIDRQGWGNPNDWHSFIPIPGFERRRLTEIPPSHWIFALPFPSPQ
jgi:hypothetical protein